MPRYCQEYRGNFPVAPVGSAPMDKTRQSCNVAITELLVVASDGLTYVLKFLINRQSCLVRVGGVHWAIANDKEKDTDPLAASAIIRFVGVPVKVAVPPMFDE